MEDDSECSVVPQLREWVKAQVDACQDAELLDLVYKLLLQG